MENLYEKIRTTKWRRFYGRFGHDAIVNCKWCQDETDYGMYVLSKVCLVYIYALVALGLGTLLWRKETWRFMGVCLVSVPFMIDVYCYALLPMEGMSGTLDKGVLYNLYDVTGRTRHFLLFLIFLILCFWDRKGTYTDSDYIQEIINKNGTTYARAMSLRLARSTILATSDLRRRFLEFYKEKDSDKDAIERDLEYQVCIFSFDL